MKKQILLLGTILGFITFSCNSPLNEEVKKDDPPIQVRSGFDDYKLTESDIGTLGSAHNAKLAAFYEDLLTNTPSFGSKSNFRDYIRDYDYDITGIDVQPGSDAILDIYDDITNNYIDELIEDDVDEMLEMLSTTTTVSQLNTLIGAKIDELEEDEEISIERHNAVMAMLGVLKYSAYFWYDTDNGGSGQGRYYMTQLNSEYPSFYPAPGTVLLAASTWKDTAAKDAMGAATGMLEWCIWGACTGVGTLGGLVGGALYGAVTGSIL